MGGQLLGEVAASIRPLLPQGAQPFGVSTFGGRDGGTARVGSGVGLQATTIQLRLF
ncbi:MAG: hypothetical protein ACU4EQ_04900 [Candidatus Nitrosoglobus sp.]